MRLAAALALGLCACGGGELRFEARVADLRRPGNHFAMQKEPGDVVNVTARGKMLDPMATLPKSTRETADWSTPENAVASVIAANAAGDLPWIVRNYAAAERPEAGRQLQEPMAAARTRAFYLNLGAAKLMGWGDLGEYRVMFLRGDDGDGDPSVVSVVLKKTDEGWRQTTGLGRDDRFDVMVAAVRSGGVR